MLEAVECSIHFPVSQLFAGLSRLELELGSEEVSGSGIAYFPVFLHIINTITIMTTTNPILWLQWQDPFKAFIQQIC